MFLLFRLKHLNLEKNEISAVPQLESKTIKHDNMIQSEAGPNQTSHNDGPKSKEAEGMRLSF